MCVRPVGLDGSNNDTATASTYGEYNNDNVNNNTTANEPYIENTDGMDF